MIGKLQVYDTGHVLVGVCLMNMTSCGNDNRCCFLVYTAVRFVVHVFFLPDDSVDV